MAMNMVCWWNKICQTQLRSFRRDCISYGGAWYFLAFGPEVIRNNFIALYSYLRMILWKFCFAKIPLIFFVTTLTFRLLDYAILLHATVLCMTLKDLLSICFWWHSFLVRKAYLWMYLVIIITKNISMVYYF